MSSTSKKQLPFREWPAGAQQRWEAVFEPGDLFDDPNRGAHLAPSTREALRVSFAQYLRFISDHHDELLDCPPEARINRQLISEYVSLLRKTNQETSVATSLHHLRLALRLIYSDIDWSWLLTITKRIAATAPRKARKLGSMTSERLYLLGIELMDRAAADAHRQCKISKATAMEYRDGLLIALLALFIPRRRTVDRYADRRTVGTGIFPQKTPRTNKLSTFRSPPTCRDESIHTCENFEFAFVALMAMMGYGLQTNGG
jgi:hypothetical protein